VQRAHRLRKGPEFDTVYAKGTVTNGPLLVIRRLPNSLGHPRWGFAVGKRLAKQAVRRNRTRRRLRELARSLPVSDSFDLIVTARRGSMEATTSELADAVRRALRRAGVSLDGENP
jgi:ribonuclease P protein component